jgi:hypothetical protein
MLDYLLALAEGETIALAVQQRSQCNKRGVDW